MKQKISENTIKTIKTRYIIYFGFVLFIIVSLMNIYDIDIVNNSIKELAIDNIKIRLFPYFIISLIIVIFQYLLFSISLTSLKETKNSIFIFPLSQLLGISINYNKKTTAKFLIYGHLIIAIAFYLLLLRYTLKTHQTLICVSVIILSNFFLYLIINDLLKVLNKKTKYIPIILVISLTVGLLIFYFTLISQGKLKYFNLDVSHQTISAAKQENLDIIIYSKDLSYRNFNGANFSNCVIVNTNFSNSTFIRANLYNANLAFSNFENCKFNKAKLIFTNFSQKNKNNNFKNVVFFCDTISYVNFNKCDLSYTNGFVLKYLKNEPTLDFLKETIFPDIIMKEITKDSISWFNYRHIIIVDSIYINPYYNDTVKKYDNKFF